MSIYYIIEKETYPYKLEKVSLNSFKTLAEAQKQMIKLIRESKKEIYEFIITEHVKKIIENKINYDGEGRFIGITNFHIEEKIKAMPLDNPKFPIGTIVEINDDTQVIIGMVSHVPYNSFEMKKYEEKYKKPLYEEDMAYVIITEDLYDHFHAKEFELRKANIFHYTQETEESLKKHLKTIYPAIK